MDKKVKIEKTVWTHSGNGIVIQSLPGHRDAIAYNGEPDGAEKYMKMLADRKAREAAE